MELVRYITAQSFGLEIAGGNELGDGIYNERSFTIIITRFVEENFFACAAVTEEAFLFAIAGAVDHAHGNI
jgi:hypothetical protein